MKLIFLDIDGVLNSQSWFESEECQAIPINTEKREVKRWFDPRCVALLNALTDDTKAKLVISSTWRKGNSLEELREIFKKVGIRGEVIGVTPALYFNGVEDYNYSVPRGCEIKAWLEMNKGVLNAKISKANYVIFDDDSDMLWWQRSNFIWVDQYVGLTRTLVYKAMQKLS